MLGVIRKLILIIIPVLFLINANHVWAIWEVEKAPATKPPLLSEKIHHFYQQNRSMGKGIEAYPYLANMKHRGRPEYALSISGSLRENLERIMTQYHWTIIWKASYDYNYDGRVSGNSIQSIVEKMLHPFPLQMRMNDLDRTIEIRSRMES